VLGLRTVRMRVVVGMIVPTTVIVTLVMIMIVRTLV
jgi:hypothetical protein